MWTTPKTCRAILLLSYADNNISDEELFYYTTVIAQKIQISAINRTMFSIWKTWIQLTAKPDFELKRQTFLALSCRCLTYSRSVPLQTENHLWWFGGTVCSAEMNKLSLQIQQYDSMFSKTSFCFEFDYKWSHGFYLWQHCHLVTEWNRDVLSSVALQQYTAQGKDPL